MTHPNVLEIKDLRFSYQREPVLENVNISIETGDFVAMIGPNGGGKTTLLKLILGILSPEYGSIRVLGHPPGKKAGQIGYVPQNVSINDNFPISVLDVVLMGKLGNGNGNGRIGMKKQFRQEAIETLDRIGMSGYENRKIGELSVGQKQRVFIARALVTRPKLLLLDEPTANVDAEGQGELYRMLKELNEEMTILVVSHEWLVISAYIKSVACVNRQLHFHHQPEIDSSMMDIMYPGSTKDGCPVELVAHGVPHRVLQSHDEMKDD